MRIQTARPEDKDGILRLYGQFNEDRIASGVGDAKYKTLEGEMPWSRTLTDEECFTLVARKDNLVLGFITVRMPEFNPFNKTGKLGEVDLIVVDKKLRRRHLGKALFDAALSELKTLGVANILLNVKMGNIPAMLFWSAQGFKKISDTEYKRSDGAKEKTMYMVKKI